MLTDFQVVKFFSAVQGFLPFHMTTAYRPIHGLILVGAK